MTEISSSIVALHAPLTIKAASVGVSIAPVDEALPVSRSTNATQTISVESLTGALSPQALLAVQEGEETATQDSKRETGDSGKESPDEASDNPQDLTPNEQAQVTKLQQIDAEVRRHEQAHAAAGGGQVGAPSYEYTKGPDGKQYATGGEVSISVPVGGSDPESRIDNLRQVQQAALAPSNPSPQDLRVAASAAQGISQAQGEIRQEQAIENNEEIENSKDATEEMPETHASDISSQQAAEAFQAAANLTANQSPKSIEGGRDTPTDVVA